MSRREVVEGSKLEPRDLERMRYRGGQMLRSQDFRDLALNEAHLRWWHNRALHRPYGIVHGFEVEINGDFIYVRPDTVHERPGVAYDAYGRELVLTREQRIPIPPHGQPCRLCDGHLCTDPTSFAQGQESRTPRHDETIVLLVRYAEPDAACGEPVPAEHCWPRRATGAEGIEFVWCVEAETSYRSGVRVARLLAETTAALESAPAAFFSPTARVAFRPEAGALAFHGVMAATERDALLAQSSDPQFRTAIKALFRQSQPDYRRRNARALSRPRSASGTTVPEATPWTVWTLPEPQEGGRPRAGFEVQIDISAAGFTEVPCTFAWLQGSVPLLYQALLEEQDWLVELDSHVAEVTARGFVFRLIVTVHGVEVNVSRVQRVLTSALRQAEIYVSWLGIEPAR